jgi:hypothetical protein
MKQARGKQAELSSQMTMVAKAIQQALTLR